MSGKIRDRLMASDYLLRWYSVSWVRTILSSTSSVRENKAFAFIVGCYNSGTSLLKYLLSQHNDISGLPTEGAAITSQILRPEDFGWNRMWYMCRERLEIQGLDRKPNVRKLKKHWGFWFDSSKALFLEKSIINSLNIDWLEDNFNSPYFIWIVRNGYAVAEGIRRRTSESGKHPCAYGNGYPIEMCARQWVVNNQIVEAKIGKCRNYLLIYYEDLVEKMEDTLENIFTWLPLRQGKTDCDRSFTFHGEKSEIKNMNEESISRLSSEETAVISEVAGAMLKRHNYKLLEGRS